MSKITYTPTSHFFTEHEKLAFLPQNDIYEPFDAFGPVKPTPENQGSAFTQYRTTSFVKADKKSKVFAICKGQLLIQPQTDDPEKVNLILKPLVSFAPLKIKYFIYRGVDKKDFMNEDDELEKSDEQHPDRPNEFLKKIWKAYTRLNNVSDESIDEIPAEKIGYIPNLSGTQLIDAQFISFDFQLPMCKGGEWIGNFSNRIGLDIVLDQGEYMLDQEEELFKLDLAFARKQEHVFDLNSPELMGNEGKKKKYKEYILQFLDAAAFWGSHADCGKIILANGSNYSNSQDIYSNIVAHYQTKNNIYLYVKSERGRSYSFYEFRILNFGLAGSPLGSNYATTGWPIVIKTFPQTATPNLENLQLSFDSKTALFGLVPGSKTDTFYLENTCDLPLKNASSTTGSPGTVSIASFFMFTYLKWVHASAYKRNNYMNDLWKANLKPTFEIPRTQDGDALAFRYDDVYQWSAITENTLANLKAVSPIKNTLMHQKVVFEYGEHPVTKQRKQRRLYIAALGDTFIDPKDNRSHLLVNSPTTACYMQYESDYLIMLYHHEHVEVYKGSITDGTETIPTLTLVSNSDYELTSCYFQLGIMEEEYNHLIYNKAEKQEQSSHIPPGATNFSFHLEELRSPGLDPAIDVLTDFRKYKVGLKYEHASGVISEDKDILYPLTPVVVYTTDDQYFFSKEYAEYQKFYKQVAADMVHFRTMADYEGEFGFDWLRIGDTGERSYADLIVSGYEGTSTNDNNNSYEKDGPNIEHSKEAARALKNEYQRIPNQQKDAFYYVPWLTIFPETYIPPVIPDHDAPLLPPRTVNLRVLMGITGDWEKIECDYDRTVFEIEPALLYEKSNPGNISTQISLRCKTAFNENTQLKVLAYPANGGAPQLAGKINVLKNGLTTIKQQKILLVSVTSHPDPSDSKTELTGKFIPEELIFLQKLFHQTLMIASIHRDRPAVSVVNDPNYEPYKGKFRTGHVLVYNNIASCNESSNDLCVLLATKADYGDACRVFCFDEKAYLTGQGRLEGFGTIVMNDKKCVLLFLGRQRHVIGHEVFHTLNLSHSFGIVGGETQKYVFPETNFTLDPNRPGHYLQDPNATDNIMSYNDSSPSSWRWQWDIVRANVK